MIRRREYENYFFNFLGVPPLPPSVVYFLPTGLETPDLRHLGVRFWESVVDAFF